MQLGAAAKQDAGRRASTEDIPARAATRGGFGDGGLTLGWWPASSPHQPEGQAMHARWCIRSSVLSCCEAGFQLSWHYSDPAGSAAQPGPKRRRLSGTNSAAISAQQAIPALHDARRSDLGLGGNIQHASCVGGIDASMLVGRAVEGTIESCTPAGYMVELRSGMHVMRGALVSNKCAATVILNGS